MEILIKTLETIGTVMIAFAALRVHHRVLHEHKMDAQVFRVMRREQTVGVVGVLCILIAFVLTLLQV